MAQPNPAPTATEADRIHRIFSAQQANRAAVKRTTGVQRAGKLAKLRDAIKAREPAIRKAMFDDFRKSATEVDITEIYASLVELKDAIHNVAGWMRPKRVPTPLSLAGTKSAIYYEPKGVVLIIGPWNYPFQLCIAPLVAAVAAGNCAIVKPSELTPHTSHLLAELVADVFDEAEVAVVEGGIPESTALLALPFDHFFFTGSTKVGKIVAEAAAKHLASTTLELGGKSPCIVDDSADLHLAARRIAWGKFVNAGQTCIAPDYIMVSEKNRDALVDELGRAIGELYGASDDARKQSPDLCRVIDDRNFARLNRMLDDTVAKGAKVAVGGQRDAAERYIAPTVLTDVAADTAVMAEEIFGPILPVLTFKQLDEVPAFVTARDKPLALYIFGENRAAIDSVIDGTTAGGTCVNNTVIHFANSNLPFGGVGPSGSGNYHGMFGFKAFSHERAVLRQGRIDMLKTVYPPYGPKVTKMLKWMFKLFA
ncbi:MAG TPA: aldehyde dehydrogenase family protein [Kofleriaceae bacterium]|jgi:aldehyde dehydrogenase (NAD+)